MDKKLGTNLVLNILYHILVIFVPFITAPYLGRVLGAQQIGEYTYVHSFVTYFGYFAMLGLSNYGSKEIAKVRDNKAARSKIFAEIYTMQLITASTSLILYIAFSFFINSQYQLIEICMIAWVASNLLDIGWYYMGMERFKAIVIRNVIIKTVNVVLILALIKSNDDLIQYVIIMAGGQLVSQALLWATISGDITVVKPRWADVKRHFKPNVLLFIPAIAASIYQIMDKIMIGAISSSNQLAYYEYADKLIQVPSIVFSAMGTVMLSRMSSIQGGRDAADSGRNLIYYSIDFTMIVGAASAFGLAAIANELVYLYYGAEFLESGNILKYLTPVIILNGWSNVLRMQYIIPRDKSRVYIVATASGAIINVILNAIFIPMYEGVGAVLGTVFAQIVVTAIYTYYANGDLILKKALFRNIPIMFSGAVMFCAIKLFQNTHEIGLFGLMLDVIIGGAIYVICVILFEREQGHLITLIKRNLGDGNKRRGKA